MSNILAKWLHYLWLLPNIWGILINLLHLCGIFLKIQEILVKIHTFAVVWLNDGLFKFFSKAGSFIWWSMRIFRLFLIFTISDALCLCFVYLINGYFAKNAYSFHFRNFRDHPSLGR